MFSQNDGFLKLLSNLYTFVGRYSHNIIFLRWRKAKWVQKFGAAAKSTTQTVASKGTPQIRDSVFTSYIDFWFIFFDQKFMAGVVVAKLCFFMLL
jgi:hypothetical protein